MTNATLNETTHKKAGTWLEIDLGKLRSNLSVIKSRLAPHTGILAIVKANAYGHGMVPSAKTLEGAIDYFGVSSVEEAVELRENGILKPILIFGFAEPQDVPLLLKYDLTLSLSDLEHGTRLNDLLVELGCLERLKVHLKIDTGMSRLGFSFRDGVRDIMKLREYSTLNLEGIFTHFAVADKKDEKFTHEQLIRFNRVLDGLKRSGIEFKWCHAANSGGILNFKESHFNLVRPGITLYGLYDDGGQNHNLEPVMTWKTRVALIRNLEPGDTVSYNRRFKAEKPTRVAILPMGYSHGYPVALSAKSSVVIRGKRYPIAGQVCMDYTVVHIGDSVEVQEGDEVLLIGSSGSAHVTAVELAKLAGTISYEIVTRLGTNLVRYYHDRS